jgi:IclR helix-turn-helix domain
MTFVDEAADVIRKAIDAIDSERERLSKVLDSLNGSSPTEPRRRPPARRTTARKTRRSPKRAPKGSRRQEVLNAIDRKPGMTGARLAKELGMPASQVYNICATLVKEKMIRKRGTTYEPMPGAPATAATA